METSTQKSYRKIWQTVLNIPSGKVASYGQIADLAGLPGRARMVGKALGHAPESMQLPWHRVLRSNGQIAFSVGSEQNKTQIAKLRQEGVPVYNNRVKLTEFAWRPDLGEILGVLSF